VLRYDQKRSTSKMVSSITTLGYFVLLLTCYWPFGGWFFTAKRRMEQNAPVSPDVLPKKVGSA